MPIGFTRLTDKQERFCRAIADGHTQFDAYRIAYNPTSTNRATLDNNAYMIAKNPKIKARINELRAMRDYRECYDDINDLQKRYRLIWDRIAACIEKGDDNAVDRYLTQIAKLKGDYITQVKDISEQKSQFSSMSTDDIKALLNTDTE